MLIVLYSFLFLFGLSLITLTQVRGIGLDLTDLPDGDLGRVAPQLESEDCDGTFLRSADGPGADPACLPGAECCDECIHGLRDSMVMVLTRPANFVRM